MSRSFSPPKRTAFFLLLSLAILLAVAVGFGPTFYLRSAFGTVDRFTGSASLSPHLAVHGVVLTAWFSLFAMQALLVKLGYARLHRRLGVAGLVLAGAAVASSAFTVHRAIPRAMEAAAAAGAPLDAAAGGHAAARSCGRRARLLGARRIRGARRRRGVSACEARRAQAAHAARVGVARGSRVLDGPADRPAVAPYVPGGILPSEVFLALCIVALVIYDLTSSRRIERATVWGGAVALAAFTASAIMLRGESGTLLARWIAGLPG